MKRFWPTKTKSTNINKIENTQHPKEMANKLNDFFCEIGPSLSRKFDNDPEPVINNVNPPIYELKETDYATIERLLLKLGPSKSCGSDGITSRLLRDAGDNVIIPLLHIINISIKCKTFPDTWKHAVITPIHKEGDRTCPGNYRPISILNVCSKLAEQVVHEQLYDIVTRSNFLSDAQAGFRKGYSTTTCLIDFLNGIYGDIEAKKGGGVLFLDLKKAFDTVDHNILLLKLKGLGLKESSVSWFRSYLSGRTQSTKCNGKVWRLEVLKWGYPRNPSWGI